MNSFRELLEANKMTREEFDALSDKERADIAAVIKKKMDKNLFGNKADEYTYRPSPEKIKRYRKDNFGGKSHGPVDLTVTVKGTTFNVYKLHNDDTDSYSDFDFDVRVSLK